MFCPHVRHLAAKYLGILPESHSLARFLLCERDMSDASITLFAILVHAVYRTTNHARNHGVGDSNEVFDMMEHFCKMAVQGHPASQKVLHSATHARHI